MRTAHGAPDLIKGSSLTAVTDQHANPASDPATAAGIKLSFSEPHSTPKLYLPPSRREFFDDFARGFDLHGETPGVMRAGIVEFRRRVLKTASASLFQLVRDESVETKKEGMGGCSLRWSTR